MRLIRSAVSGADCARGRAAQYKHSSLLVNVSILRTITITLNYMTDEAWPKCRSMVDDNDECECTCKTEGRESVI
mgnify:CR=1 FL=1